MKKLASTLLISLFACGAFAAADGSEASKTDSSAPPTLSKGEAKDLKVHADAEYKARKKVADAAKDLNKADCETSADGSVERACKKNASASAKQDKAAAKELHEKEKAEIKDLAK